MPTFYVMSWENWQLEAVDLDGKRIDKVRASLIMPAKHPIQTRQP